MEKLVAALFECEGYKTAIPSKKHFAGWSDADIKAEKSDKFSETKILVQVKHHSGVSGKYGIDQLQEIQKHTHEYNDYMLIFITTAQIAQEVRDKGERCGIILMDGAELVDWLFTYIDDLGEEMKTQLRISSVPYLC